MSEKQLVAAYLAAVEAHKSHPPRLRLDPDGVHRCPACDPVWGPVVPYVPRGAAARCFWWVARAVVAWWEGLVDRVSP